MLEDTEQRVCNGQITRNELFNSSQNHNSFWNFSQAISRPGIGIDQDVLEEGDVTWNLEEIEGSDQLQSCRLKLVLQLCN